MMKKILILIIIGVLISSGVGITAVTSGVTLSSQKQLESREPENKEKLQFGYLHVHVNEIYGTVDDPQYRPLANVTVEIKVWDLIYWYPHWIGTTDESGEVAITIIESSIYKATVSKDGYHTFGCSSSKIVITTDLWRYDVYFTMAEDGGPFVKQISQSNQQSNQHSSNQLLLKMMQSVFLNIRGYTQ